MTARQESPAKLRFKKLHLQESVKQKQLIYSILIEAVTLVLNTFTLPNSNSVS